LNKDTPPIPDNPLFPYGKQRIERSRGIKRLILRSFPLHFLSALRQEVHFFLIRIQYHLSRKPAVVHDKLVNLGCGDTGLPGWLNVDGYPGKNIDLVFDIRKRIPLPDACAKGIYCEHFLEHLEYSEEVPFFIAACFRIQQPGDWLRTVFHDVENKLRP